MNDFENLDILLDNLRDAKEPVMRQRYLESIIQLIEIGEQLDKLNPSEETRKGIEKLEKIKEDYVV